MSVNLGRLFSTDPLHAQFFNLNKENIDAYLENTQKKIESLLKSKEDQLKDDAVIKQISKDFVLSLRDSREVEKWVRFSPETQKYEFYIEASVMSLFYKTLEKMP